MLRAMRWMLVVVTVLLVGLLAGVQAADKDEMVVNPYYKFWSKHKSGSTVTLVEKTAFTGPEKELVPDGIDEKEITYKLLSSTPDSVTVQVVVLEREFLSSVESAPTKKIYPAKVTPANLHAGLHGVDPKRGEEALEVLGKKLMCLTVSGTEKKEGTEIEHKVWLSETVPGGIVKHHRVTKQNGKTVADTTIAVKSYKEGD
jgi:hypothetical protein